MAEDKQEESVRTVYQHAAELMRNGTKDKAIISNLINQGLNEEFTNVVVSHIAKARKKGAETKARPKNMGVGTLWCIGGLFVTAATYSAASNGRHMLSLGASSNPLLRCQ